MSPVQLAVLGAGGVGLIAGALMVAKSGPPPLTEEERESWSSRHPLTPPPEREPPDTGALARLRMVVLGCCAIVSAHGILGAFQDSLHAYLHIAVASCAVLWAVAILTLVKARLRGELVAAPPTPGGKRPGEARRWEILDLYCERLAGEIATGVHSTRGDLARRARKVFRGKDDLAFLRHLRTASGSEAYRRAAGQILDDLG